MELLAPAGTFAAFEAALEEGADAVYVGAPVLNARALARDFSFSEIALMVDRAKKAGRKIYIAMNSLVKETEIPMAIESLTVFSQLRPHGLIIQDMGLFYLAKEYFPSLTLHASTLMSVHNSMAVKYLIKKGFERVVLARELTIDEIKTIYRQTGAKLEVFIHGAMCFSYSGLCLFSSLHGGKSSLRGQCVQPCRRRYKWLNGKGLRRNEYRKGISGYLFSMNDLCGIDLLPDLKRAGVMSLKIEGRLKSAEYVRKVVRAYRIALDTIHLPKQQRIKILSDAYSLLDDAMGRKRSTGFFNNPSSIAVINPSFSGTSGLRIARITLQNTKKTEVTKYGKLLEIALLAPVTIGDRLRFHDERSGESFSFTLKKLMSNGNTTRAGNRGQNVQILFPIELFKSARSSLSGWLYKIDTSNRRNREQIIKIRQRESKKINVTPDYQRIRQVLGSLELRQHEQTTKISSPSHYNKNAYSKRRKSGKQFEIWWIKVPSLNYLERKMIVRPKNIIVDLSRENLSILKKQGIKNKQFLFKVVWALPPVILEKELRWCQNSINELIEWGFYIFQLGHYSQLDLFATVPADKKKNLLLYGDYTFNVLNSLSLMAVADMNLAGVQFSLESDKENISLGISHFRHFRNRQNLKTPFVIGFMVYGKLALFTSRVDSNHYKYNKIFISPKNEMYSIERKDDLTRVRPLAPLSLLQNQEEIKGAGVDYMLIELIGDSPKKEAALVASLLKKTAEPGSVLSGNFNKKLL